MRNTLLFLLSLLTVSSSISAKVAVFPPQGVNADKSFLNAFGTVLANKYRKISDQEVISPRISSKAISEDSSLVDAAQKLGVDEYLETEAVGLYVSRKEKVELTNSGASGDKQPIILKIENDSKGSRKAVENQELLDNHKTIVSVIRRNSSGKKIHMVEMTLLTYGDIEESTDRMARALFQKVSVDEVIRKDNITRKEEMRENRLFVESLKGIKMGIFHPADSDVDFTSIVNIGYNQRMETDKMFFEFGINAKLPTKFESDNRYGGVQLEMGGSFFLPPKVSGLYAGLGVSPYLNFGNMYYGLQIGVLPFFQLGITFPKASSIRGFVHFKIGQNAIKVRTGGDEEYDYETDSYIENESTESYPTEIGAEFGIGF